MLLVIIIALFVLKYLIFVLCHDGILYDNSHLHDLICLQILIMNFQQLL